MKPDPKPPRKRSRTKLANAKFTPSARITSARKIRESIHVPGIQAARDLAAIHSLTIHVFRISGDKNHPDQAHVSIRAETAPKKGPPRRWTILDWLPDTGKAWRGGMAGSNHALVRNPDGSIRLIPSINDAVLEAIHLI